MFYNIDASCFLREKGAQVFFARLFSVLNGLKKNQKGSKQLFDDMWNRIRRRLVYPMILTIIIVIIHILNNKL